MDITIKYAIFAVGALIIIAILLHAFSKAPKSAPQQVIKPGAKPVVEKPAPLAAKKVTANKKLTRPAHKAAMTEPTLGNLSTHAEPKETVTEAELAPELETAQDHDLVSESAIEVQGSHHDITPEIQEELERAANVALAASRGEPHQVELPFADHEVVWEDVVKTTFEKRMQKMPEGVPDTMKRPEPSPQVMNEIVVLNVIAPRSTVFRGRDIIEVLDAQGMGFGKHGIYHSYSDDGTIEFSVASVYEPGYFDLSTIESFTTSGLTFFIDLARVPEPKLAFKRMLTVVHEVSRKLGGDILDEHRQRLTQASVSEYLARIKGVESRRKNYG